MIVQTTIATAATFEGVGLHSGKPVRAKPIPAKASLGDAPGTYVMQRYPEP